MVSAGFTGRALRGGRATPTRVQEGPVEDRTTARGAGQGAPSSPNPGRRALREPPPALRQNPRPPGTAAVPAPGARSQVSRTVPGTSGRSPPARRPPPRAWTAWALPAGRIEA